MAVERPQSAIEKSLTTLKQFLVKGGVQLDESVFGKLANSGWRIDIYSEKEIILNETPESDASRIVFLTAQYNRIISVTVCREPSPDPSYEIPNLTAVRSSNNFLLVMMGREIEGEIIREHDIRLGFDGGIDYRVMESRKVQTSQSA